MNTFFCYYPSYSVLIDWNGDVFLCSQDWQRRRTMGNIYDGKIFLIFGRIAQLVNIEKSFRGKRCNSPCTINAEGTVLAQTCICMEERL